MGGRDCTDEKKGWGKTKPAHEKWTRLLRIKKEKKHSSGKGLKITPKGGEGFARTQLEKREKNVITQGAGPEKGESACWENRLGFNNSKGQQGALSDEKGS